MRDYIQKSNSKHSSKDSLVASYQSSSTRDTLPLLPTRYTQGYVQPPQSMNLLPKHSKKKRQAIHYVRQQAQIIIERGMQEHTEAEFSKMEDDYLPDEAAVKRWPLLMIPKDNDYDPEFPAMFYRKGKYVTMQTAQKQEHLEHMSKTLYDLCVEEKREDTLQCYRQKCAIFRGIIGAMQAKKP